MHYTANVVQRTKKRAIGSRGEQELVTEEERAVLIPRDHMFVFVLTCSRGERFRVPQPYKRGDRVLNASDMNEAERYVREHVRQFKVWAPYED